MTSDRGIRQLPGPEWAFLLFLHCFRSLARSHVYLMLPKVFLRYLLCSGMYFHFFGLPWDPFGDSRGFQRARNEHICHFCYFMGSFRPSIGSCMYVMYWNVSLWYLPGTGMYLHCFWLAWDSYRGSKAIKRVQNCAFFPDSVTFWSYFKFPLKSPCIWCIPMFPEVPTSYTFFFL